MLVLGCLLLFFSKGACWLSLVVFVAVFMGDAGSICSCLFVCLFYICFWLLLLLFYFKWGGGMGGGGRINRQARIKPVYHKGRNNVVLPAYIPCSATVPLVTRNAKPDMVLLQDRIIFHYLISSYSPWRNCTCLLGVKHQFTYLLFHLTRYDFVVVVVVFVLLLLEGGGECLA